MSKRILFIMVVLLGAIAIFLLYQSRQGFAVIATPISEDSQIVFLVQTNPEHYYDLYSVDINSSDITQITRGHAIRGARKLSGSNTIELVLSENGDSTIY